MPVVFNSCIYTQFRIFHLIDTIACSAIFSRLYLQNPLAKLFWCRIVVAAAAAVALNFVFNFQHF